MFVLHIGCKQFAAKRNTFGASENPDVRASEVSRVLLVWTGSAQLRSLFTYCRAAQRFSGLPAITSEKLKATSLDSILMVSAFFCN